ncbi:MAG: carbohydrate ABC transporter permease [Thaumarchaeota archaeon]|nr:carbohydrate ABC transporter permease [Nitrososphaerales archaeon]NSL73788.1 carbohydrate ABC transporter permease [Nitrososphaerota archaeon]NSL75641.1 carbohydrate ABC transporter permease [Nitrososphaerota archaeon]NSL77513.1 carbohydrate ABC transporter permease [Nitrososphaerota archaeon]PXF23412.1 MAG: ABC transporter permease [Nitrososphaerota archaeon]
MSQTNKNNSRYIRYILLIFASLWVLWPISIMIEEGFRVDIGPAFSGRGASFVGEFFQGQGGIRFTTIEYVKALKVEAYPRLLVNSSIIAVSSVVVAILAGLPAGFTMAMYKFRGKTFITYALLAMRTISPFAVLLPFFLIYGRLGLFDTYQGMAFVYLIINLPIITMMMRGFFKDIPKEIFEAAFMSGASDSYILRKVALPLALPGLAAAAVFAFVGTWNEFFYALFLTGTVTKTVSRGVWSGFSESIESFKILEFDELNAGGTLAIIPAVILSLAVQRYLARGVTLGAAE